MNNWYKFLTEQQRTQHYLSFKQLEGLFRIFHLSGEILGDSQYTGGFQFTPRVPRSPMTGEDDFTNRISLAPSVNRAIYALDGLTIKNQNRKRLYNQYYVYAGDLKSDSSDDIDTVKLNIELRRCKKDLVYTDTKGNKRTYTNYEYQHGKTMPWDFFGYVGATRRDIFGTDDCYSLSGEEKRRCFEMGGKVTSPKKFDDFGMPEEKEKFYACVPDAYDTKEEWSLSPVTLYYIGRLDIDNKRVAVDEDSLNLIKLRLRKGRVKEKTERF